jgi:hypothetical protein
MATAHRKYTEEFKREAVQLMESSGKPIAERARALGSNDNKQTVNLNLTDPIGIEQRGFDLLGMFSRFS